MNVDRKSALTLTGSLSLLAILTLAAMSPAFATTISGTFLGFPVDVSPPSSPPVGAAWYNSSAGCVMVQTSTSAGCVGMEGDYTSYSLITNRTLSSSGDAYTPRLPAGISNTGSSFFSCGNALTCLGGDLVMLDIHGSITAMTPALIANAGGTYALDYAAPVTSISGKYLVAFYSTNPPWQSYLNVYKDSGSGYEPIGAGFTLNRDYYGNGATIVTISPNGEYILIIGYYTDGYNYHTTVSIWQGS